jgi:hypothetical protein
MLKISVLVLLNKKLQYDVIRQQYLQCIQVQSRRYQQDKLTLGLDRVEWYVEDVEGDWLDDWTDEAGDDEKDNEI